MVRTAMQQHRAYTFGGSTCWSWGWSCCRELVDIVGNDCCSPKIAYRLPLPWLIMNVTPIWVSVYTLPPFSSFAVTGFSAGMRVHGRRPAGRRRRTGCGRCGACGGGHGGGGGLVQPPGLPGGGPGSGPRPAAAGHCAQCDPQGSGLQDPAGAGWRRALPGGQGAGPSGG